MNNVDNLKQQLNKLQERVTLEIILANLTLNKKKQFLGLLENGEYQALDDFLEKHLPELENLVNLELQKVVQQAADKFETAQTDE